jgi:hypothetical protein
MRLENGDGASLENVLRVARALGVLDSLVTALDPYATDVGRLRSQEALPKRIRPPRPDRERGKPQAMEPAFQHAETERASALTGTRPAGPG